MSTTDLRVTMEGLAALGYDSRALPTAAGMSGIDRTILTAGFRASGLGKRWRAPSRSISRRISRSSSRG
jgi:hypothetical protein